MKEPLAGRATPEATRRYCESRGAKLQPPGGITLGSTGVRASGVGFGSYRIHEAVERHDRSLDLALRSGVNLIDTSANYGDGGSEELIGRVVRRLADAGELRREEIVIVTKGGYVQGQNLDLATERERAGRPFAEMTKVYPECWHCIHPDFIADQIDRSLARLGMETADVYLLHNPEYFLEVAHQQGNSVTDARAEYYRRIAEAFELLESKAREGKIAAYGISSNTFPKSEGQFDFTSLEECWAIAERIGADHHFRVIQLPINLFENGAWMEKNQAGRAQTVLDFAASKNLGVLVNRPLNAFSGGKLIRLADPPKRGEDRVIEINSRLQALGTIEGEAETLVSGAERMRGPGFSPGLAKLVAERWESIPSGTAWNRFIGQDIVPRAREALTAIGQITGGSQEFQDWQQRYIQNVNSVLEALGDYFEAKGRGQMDAIHEAIAPLIPADFADAPLSQKAIWWLRSLPGVTTVLVGMRREEYVEDCIEAASRAPGKIDGSNSAEVVRQLETLG